MTISAPQNGKAPLFPGRPAYLDETMEEVATPLNGVAPSETPRTVANENAPFGQVAAPLHAPHFDQVAYHREWRNGPGRDRFVASVKRWQQRNPEKRRAHYDVDNALRAGRLVKGPCERLGDDCKGRIEAHHDDYSKTLEVRWLCKRHHKAADRERAELERSLSSDLRSVAAALHLVVALIALALAFESRVWDR